jgi:hypothetical protein
METQSTPQEGQIINKGTYAEVIGNNPVSYYDQQDQSNQDENSEPAATETTETVETSQPANTSEQVDPASQPPVETSQPAPKVEPPAPAPVEQDWKTVLSNVDKREVLKAAGLDDFDIDLIEYRKSTGDLTPYLEAKTVNYKDMPADEIMRRDLQLKYPGISAKALDFKFNEEVIKKYNLDSTIYSEDEVAIGKELLEFDANQKRQQFIENQAKFKAPERQPDNSAELARQQQEQERQAYNQSIQQHPVTQALLSNKRLVLDGGAEKFNYEVADANEAVDMMLNPDKYSQYFATSDGQPNVEALLQVTAFVRNRQQFIKSLIDYGKSLGTKEIVDNDLHNMPGKAETTAPPAGPSDWKDAFRRGEVRHGTYGG